MTKGFTRPASEQEPACKSINSDGVDPEGRREAGQADDEDKCRVVRSRDLAVLGFTSNSCDSSSTSSSSTSSSDTSSEISEPRNEMTEEERDDDVSADMCQPSNEEAPIRRPRNPSEPTPEEKEKHWAVHLPYRSWCPVCVKARGREDPTPSSEREDSRLGIASNPMDYAEVEIIKKKVKQESCLLAETGSRSLRFAIS